AASSLAFGAAVLRSKQNMIWYPEGGHSKTGELGPLKQGTGMLLHRYPVLVVPVCIKGTRDALPPDRWAPRLGRHIQIVFGQPVDLQLTSTAFQEGQPIPPVYTADGLNKSPPLKWSEPPGGTKALALVCEDPDAPKGTFTHWVAFNIPPESRELGEDMPKEQK